MSSPYAALRVHDEVAPDVVEHDRVPRRVLVVLAPDHAQRFHLVMSIRWEQVAERRPKRWKEKSSSISNLRPNGNCHQETFRPNAASIGSNSFKQAELQPPGKSLLNLFRALHTQSLGWFSFDRGMFRHRKSSGQSDGRDAFSILSSSCSGRDHGQDGGKSFSVTDEVFSNLISTSAFAGHLSDSQHGTDKERR